MYEKEQLRALLPSVGERRMEVIARTDAYPGARIAQPCTVVQVHRRNLWYLVRFDSNGCHEAYKMPNLEPQSCKID